MGSVQQRYAAGFGRRGVILAADGTLTRVESTSLEAYLTAILTCPPMSEPMSVFTCVFRD